MDDLDKKILTALQNDFPVAERPYDIIARQMGIAGDTLLDRIESLIARGVIRRIGLSLDSRKLGYVSTLVAIRVSPDKLAAAEELINSIEEITHCYERQDQYNVWFTIIASGSDDVERILAIVREKLDLAEQDVLNLPATRLFKLDARFNPAGDDDADE